MIDNPVRRHLLLLVVLGLFLSSSSLCASAPAKGMFLVADEKLSDPRFRDRVILLVQHDVHGSAGLIVNRPSRLPLKSVIAKKSQLNQPGKTLSYGGPVDSRTLLALVKVRKNPPEPSDAVLGNIYLTGVGVLDEWPDYEREVIDFRPFVGYTGWAPGQLSVEMERGDWDVVPANEMSIFADDEQLWARLREQLDSGE
jgi:putative transcriptional regulator